MKAVKALFAGVLAFILWSNQADAGDYAERTILGFSPDGHFFAFEQFGVQDGSGFPYADIFIIDTRSDSWVEGSPYRVLLKDERAELKWARREAMVRAGNRLKSALITKPGKLLASNPPSELSADPHKVTVNARFAIPQVREAWRFELKESDFNDPRCKELLGGPAKGFTLTVVPFNGTAEEMHADSAIPESRGCPTGYAISDIVMHEPEPGKQVFAVLVSVYSFGFEGPDRRFIAVTRAAK